MMREPLGRNLGARRDRVSLDLYTDHENLCYNPWRLP
jgi:hypothetical protein